jgi:hypothetical protein
MIVEAGLRKRYGIAGPGSAYPKAFVTQRKQKRDAKRMVLSSNSEQVRSHVSILICCPSESIGNRNVLVTVISSVISATATSHARRSTRRSDRKAESIRMRQQAR